MIKILTDSTCDLKADTLKKYGINMIPLNVHFGNTAYKDNIDISPEEFYNELERNPLHPKTSQPSPHDFKIIYNELLKDGSDVISIHISSKLSGTVQSANIAKNEIKSSNIHIIDSEYVSIPLGLMAIACARAVKNGKNVSDILKIIEKLKKKMHIYFVVDTLNYLQKGGRIGKASALIGGLLNIKPILTIKDGCVCPFEKARGTMRVFNRLNDIFADFVNTHDHADISLGFAYASNLEMLKRLTAKIDTFYDSSKALTAEIGPVVGSHAGPGTIAICFYSAT